MKTKVTKRKKKKEIEKANGWDTQTQRNAKRFKVNPMWMMLNERDQALSTAPLIVSIATRNVHHTKWPRFHIR